MRCLSSLYMQPQIRSASDSDGPVALCVAESTQEVVTAQPFHQHGYVFQIEFCRCRLRGSGQFASKC